VATVLRGQGFFLHQVTTPKQFERAKKCPKYFCPSKEMQRGNEKEKCLLIHGKAKKKIARPQNKNKKNTCH
jgi:hypothetical protein